MLLRMLQFAQHSFRIVRASNALSRYCHASLKLKFSVDKDVGRIINKTSAPSVKDIILIDL